MQPNYPGFQKPQEPEAPVPQPSRLTDEKISDELGAESHTESALAPAGLKNPFWN